VAYGEPEPNEVLLTELLRRKGVTIAQAKRWRNPPWYVRLTWDEAEERDYRRWWEATVRRSPGVIGKDGSRKEWLWWSLQYGLHRCDLCADGHCPVKHALVRVGDRATEGR
jgi:hypothetical protein